MTWFKNLKVRSKLLIAFIFVLVIALAANVFTLINYVNNNAEYSAGIDAIEAELGHVLAASSHYIRARMIIRELYYPNNKVTDINNLYTEMDSELTASENELTQLSQFVQGDLKTSIDNIMPMLERYHTDTKAVIGILLNAGDVDIESQAYRDAMRSAEDMTVGMTTQYASILNSDIDGLSNSFIVQLKDTSAALSDSTAQTTVVIIIILAIMAVIILLVALYVPSLISKPLISLTGFMQKAGDFGDIDFNQNELDSIDKYGAQKDEIGRCIGAIAKFVDELNRERDTLEKIADGDLTITPSLLSDRDRVGKSIAKVLDNLNSMFGEIQSSTAQVSTGSKQVADGAQSLAQGATEQAAAIQQLSSSIAEIAERTKENASIADQTAKLSATIKENAEKGSRQMAEMITAVSEINEASRNINKIIKTIDDIAFQTNILALNAAVEAARAGQHGKGFAVVAEEVRNLASKSAEAAKDTGDMIQNSMEKAEFGNRIAGETAVSLKDIVAGINESSQLIAEIASASEQQSLGISQINIGIDQVAQVVQQNSATAEQSAAASQEMSGQSDMLQQLIAQFRLKDGVGAYRNLPSAGKPQKRIAASDRTAIHTDSGGGFGKY